MSSVDRPVPTLSSLRSDVIGIDTEVPVLDGSRKRYVFLDNAASTPTFRRIVRCIEDFLPWYSGVHRGLGYKAIVATNVYEQARRVAGEFVGADVSQNAIIFSKNTTESVNKLASRFRFKPDDVVISTMMEHHSNDLPWRKHCRVVHVGILPDGTLDLEFLRQAMLSHKGALRLVAVSGASNVTGILNPIHEIAEWAHEAGASIFVDAAQLVAHRPVNILPNNHRRHIDFIAYSAHKMYAPFGIGVLIGPREFFQQGEPDMVGGGTVGYVGIDEVEWGGLPQREEAGSPNVVGAVALAEAITILRTVGMNTITTHEQELIEYATSAMKSLPGIQLYGPAKEPWQKVGVIPFNVVGLDHSLVATIMSTEGAIGVRNGNFCAQPYMRRLLNVTPEEEKEKRSSRCDTPTLPGMVRASFGCYNNREDVDRFIEMLRRIVRREFLGKYTIDPATGMYSVDGYELNSGSVFKYFNEDLPLFKGEEVA